MKARRLHILVLLLIATCLRAVCAQEVTPAAAEESVAITQIDAQLRLYKTALLENPTAKNRVDAASLLLASETPEARKILLEVLSQADNPNARAAVCEALGLTKTGQQPIKAKEDFIKPLIGVITSEQDPVTVKLAAEATLIFNYSQVQAELEKAAVDASLPVAARANVIYAMRRHPDKQAVIKLLGLMDSAEPQIVEAARDALKSVGIVVSSDPVVRRQTLLELQQRSTEAFLRERVIRQETRLRENDADRENVWKKYLADKTTLYNLQGADAAAKITFLATHLRERDTRIKLWALDRLEELRAGVGTSKAKFSELEPVLIPLISDPSRDVRLSTAKRLASLWELNVAKSLLDQLNVETDEQVRRELLIALREACYASLGDTATGPRIPDEIRVGTLGWGVRFLNEADAEKARVGADVLAKLLEPNGMKPDVVNGYLKMLVERYAKLTPGNDITLRGYLLSAMAGLCSPRSACKEQAAKLFGGVFEQSLTDTTESVRLVAMDGIVNVYTDKLVALRKLRRDLGADASQRIRLELISLTGDFGEAQDLDWLAEKLGVAAEGDPAWQSMQKILRGGTAAVLTEWVEKIKSLAAAGRLTREQQISFFALVEQKAQVEAKVDLLREAQGNLADLYLAAGNFKQTSDYLRVLIAAGPSPEVLATRQTQLLQAYLGLGSTEDACGLLGNILRTKGLDLTSEGAVAKCIESYLSGPAATNPGDLLRALQQVQTDDAEALAAWRNLVSGWTARYAKAKKAEENDRANN